MPKVLEEKQLRSLMTKSPLSRGDLGLCKVCLLVYKPQLYSIKKKQKIVKSLSSLNHNGFTVKRSVG